MVWHITYIIRFKKQCYVESVNVTSMKIACGYRSSSILPLPRFQFSDVAIV